jgi:hypothetical protein
MTNNNYPITPSLELLKHWEDQLDEGENYDVMLFQAYQAGADQQLEQAAKWLDTCALFSEHLIITPSGDALRQAMRPKPPSLKERALSELDALESMGTCNSDTIRRALEQLPGNH